MANFDLIMPKMGESIEEATITNWFVKEGDRVEEDDVLLEIATDKVDSEIPSPVEGVVKKIFFKQDEVVAVGTVIAIIGDEGDGELPADSPGQESTPAELSAATSAVAAESAQEAVNQEISSSTERFYSPLVRTIAKEEGISQTELDAIQGSGQNGRVTKKDVLVYLEGRGEAPSAQSAVPSPAPDARAASVPASEPAKGTRSSSAPAAVKATPASISAGDEVIEMSRMRKLIAGHMIASKQTSAHVANMLEVDVTSVVSWRNRVKEEFLSREGVKLTFLPVFLEATVKALKDFPEINASVDGDNIILKKAINLGIAVSLPGNNLIVPNIKGADQLNTAGIAKSLVDLASRARSNKLNPEEISGGTFTVTNFGSFQNDIGTPIINQPEVAILAVGAIKKKPAVLETPEGDVIAIRHKMWLSLSYDHRIIDGALGGAFLKRVADYIESFDPESGTFKI